jgi:WD40 repeat protein
METLRGHSDEVLDVSFNTTGNRLVTASADCTARVYNVMTGACIAILIGHEGEISKVQFSPNGAKIITASSDRTCRLWAVETGECLQVLEGHSDEIFSCAFNYTGETIITGSKDNTCRIWRDSTYQNLGVGAEMDPSMDYESLQRGSLESAPPDYALQPGFHAPGAELSDSEIED